MIGGKTIRATNNLTLLENSNALFVEQKITLKHFLCSGLIAYFFLKSEKKRTITNIDKILKISYKNTLMSGNLIVLHYKRGIYVLEMTNKEALFRCLDYLKNTKLSALIIKK